MNWSATPDSNRDDFRPRPLKTLCLPIPSVADRGGAPPRTRTGRTLGPEPSDFTNLPSSAVPREVSSNLLELVSRCRIELLPLARGGFTDRLPEPPDLPTQKSVLKRKERQTPKGLTLCETLAEGGGIEPPALLRCRPGFRDRFVPCTPPSLRGAARQNRSLRGMSNYTGFASIA